MSDTVNNADRLAQLRADIEKLRDEARQIAEARKAVDMTQEEIARLEQIEETVSWKTDQIAAIERLARLLATGAAAGAGAEARARGGAGAGGGRRTAPDGDGGPAALFRDPRCGFNHLGDFTRAVCASGRPGAALDQRLAQMAPTTYSNEGAGAEGGYLIPPEFTAQVMEYVGEQNSMFALVDKWPINNQLLYPVDEDTPWSTSGPQAYWEGEVTQHTQSKINLLSHGIGLNKLICLCPVTDELMADAAQLAAYLRGAISKRMRWKVDYAIIRGTGAGQPLGILNSPCLKTTQRNTASHVKGPDILALYSGIYADFRSNAVWIYNQDCEADLWSMVIAGASSDVPVYLPAGTPYSNLANAPNGTIFGRPVKPHQAMSTLGTQGDILVGDLDQYILGYKSLGPNFSESIHLWFDYDVTAVKASWRLAGQPKFSKTIAAKNGTATYSAFHTLTDA